MATVLQTVSQILLPKGKGTRGGVSFTPNYNPAQPLMAMPQYRDHLNDIYSTRIANDSRTLLNDLFNLDPDVSAAATAYLTISSSADLVLWAFDQNNEVDVDGIALGNQLLNALTTTNDYTQGFSMKPTLDQLLDDLRYMMLLRGSVGGELVLDKNYAPSDVSLVDMATVQWRQPTPGMFNPFQKPSGVNGEIDLNIPTFFTSNFHQNPTNVYSFSLFVAAINTIAARTEVINELYRIMKVVGYPRLDVSVLEDVLLKNAPPAYRTDQKKTREFVETEIGKVRSAINGLGADQALVHSNAIEAKIVNDKNPGAGMQIQAVIDVLDSQNQAALKVMPAVIGKANNITTASTEARLFAMSADALNKSIAGFLTKALTFGARLNGYQGRIMAVFNPVELRPVLELEPHKTMKAARLKQDLSLGLISDLEYHMQVYGRPPASGMPQLSGTGFMDMSVQTAASVDTQEISPNQDSLGRSLAPEGGKSAKSNGVKP